MFFMRQERSMESKPAEHSVPEFGFELDEIQLLIELVESRGLAKLVVEEENRRLVIRGPRTNNNDVRPAELPVSALPGPIAAKAMKKPAAQAKRLTIESPMVGVFYRSSSPDSAPLVDVGDRVEVGQAIGVIEAMKVFSEIPSDHAGTVIEIAAKNGELVRQGAPLIYLKQD
jgi:acetyl-CoA carboxylase biotin carboxyl carrier protein